MAAVDYFLKIDGIKGESQDKTHKDEIQLHSYSFGMAQSGTMAFGGGGGAGKAHCNDFHFTMNMNCSTPKLMEHCASGQHVKAALLTARKAGKIPLEFLKIKFTDIIVSSYNVGGSGGSDGLPVDQVSLNFAKFEFGYQQQNADGTGGANFQTWFDQKTNSSSAG